MGALKTNAIKAIGQGSTLQGQPEQAGELPGHGAGHSRGQGEQYVVPGGDSTPHKLEHPQEQAEVTPHASWKHFLLASSGFCPLLILLPSVQDGFMLRQAPGDKLIKFKCAYLFIFCLGKKAFPQQKV